MYPGARGFRPGKTHSYEPAVHREQTSSSGLEKVHFIYMKNVQRTEVVNCVEADAASP